MANFINKETGKHQYVTSCGETYDYIVLPGLLLCEHVNCKHGRMVGDGERMRKIFKPYPKAKGKRQQRFCCPCCRKDQFLIEHPKSAKKQKLYMLRYKKRNPQKFRINKPKEAKYTLKDLADAKPQSTEPTAP